MIYTISFFPKHTGINVAAFERLVREYEAWLNSLGEENELYTWSIGQYSFKDGLYSSYNWPDKIGVNIYDEETALAFKLKFGL